MAAVPLSQAVPSTLGHPLTRGFMFWDTLLSQNVVKALVRALSHCPPLRGVCVWDTHPHTLPTGGGGVIHHNV